jgi:hypothetical protein
VAVCYSGGKIPKDIEKVKRICYNANYQQGASHFCPHHSPFPQQEGGAK